MAEVTVLSYHNIREFIDQIQDHLCIENEGARTDFPYLYSTPFSILQLIHLSGGHFANFAKTYRQ